MTEELKMISYMLHKDPALIVGGSRVGLHGPLTLYCLRQLPGSYPLC
jgi:hypothetical protein